MAVGVGEPTIHLFTLNLFCVPGSRRRDLEPDVVLILCDTILPLVEA